MVFLFLMFGDWRKEIAGLPVKTGGGNTGYPGTSIRPPPEPAALGAVHLPFYSGTPRLPGQRHAR